jgi:hypothetical protein
MGRAIGVPVGVIVVMVVRVPVVAIPIWAVVRAIVIDNWWWGTIDTYFGGTASE